VRNFAVLVSGVVAALATVGAGSCGGRAFDDYVVVRDAVDDDDAFVDAAVDADADADADDAEDDGDNGDVVDAGVVDVRDDAAAAPTDDVVDAGAADAGGGDDVIDDLTDDVPGQTDDPAAGTPPPPAASEPSPPPPPPSSSDAVCTASSLPLDNAGVVEPPGEGGCPPGMAPVSVGDGAFCMDRWEAFVDEIAADGTTRPFPPYASPGDVAVVARSAPGAVPQGYTSGRQAAAACARAGKRLCTDDEWLRACRGAAGTTYPYGPARQPGVCNDARARHPAVEFFGTAASWIWSELDHPCLNQLPDGLAPTGSHAQCSNDVGLHFDLMGNLHEWTADPAGTFRGGFYVDTRINGDGCLYRTTAHDVGHFDYSTGFRCCSDR
jgi:hypothetical protein